MTKLAFLASLRASLQGLPQAELEKTIEYYSEMIDDRMEDGASEEAAVADAGQPEAIAAQVLADAGQAPDAVAPAVKAPKYALKGWHIALIIIGAPVWGGLLAGVLGTAAGLAAGIVSLFAVLYAAAIALVACAVGAVTLFVRFLIVADPWPAFAWLGGGCFCAGSAILLFPAVNSLLMLTVRLIRQGCKALKNRFFKKGVAQ